MAGLPPGSQQTALRVQPSASLRTDAREIVVMPGRGLRLPDQVPFSRWVQVGKQLADICSSSAWCLGDWLIYGEAAYRGRYREAIERTSLDYQTLRNYAWVAKRFSLSRRRDALSFGHHAEVAALQEAEQDFWLRKAEELGWSVKQLRRQVRASISERSADDQQLGIDSSEGHEERPDRAQRSRGRLTIPVTLELLDNCHAAASKANLPVGEWAILVLDQGARRELGSQLAIEVPDNGDDVPVRQDSGAITRLSCRGP
jgi:hypothetical protein